MFDKPLSERLNDITAIRRVNTYKKGEYHYTHKRLHGKKYDHLKAAVFRR